MCSTFLSLFQNGSNLEESFLNIIRSYAETPGIFDFKKDQLTSSRQRIKLLFVLNRMFAQLRPNGTLILEPQSLASYSKKARKINAVTKDNFNNMKFKPNQFVEYLINDVGFSGGEIIGTPQHSALGFRRAIYVSFFKYSPYQIIIIEYTCVHNCMKLFSSSITGIQKAIAKNGCI